MKRLLIALLLLPQLATAQYREKCFTLDLSNEVKEIPVKSSFYNDTVINLQVKAPLSGLSISGVATLKNNTDSYIRVVMKDNYNYEHLVYENYPLLSDELVSQFSNTALETLAMDEVVPTSIRVELHHATIEIKSVQYIESSPERKSSVNPYSIQKAQCEYIANLLNRNLEKRKMTWRAGVTSISEKNYEEKKSMFGGKLPQLYGFDYYKGGIFVLPDSEASDNSTIAQRRSATTNQFVSEWDWRNRHGKNWITPIKNQYTCGACWAFSATAVLEAYINLYYNNQINCDLSEQELVSCDYNPINGNKGCSGGSAYRAFGYIKNNGIVKENCFPYQNERVDCSLKCDSIDEAVYLEDYHALASSLTNFHSLSENEADSLIKSKLILYPISSGILPWNHIINFIGFKDICYGDTIYFGDTSNKNSRAVIDDSQASLLGKTAWIVKNSWGEGWGNNGFAQIILNKNNMNLPHYLSGKITCVAYSDSDITITDADGDGYYFWGIGSKPATCPSWVPDIPDGDDSDINYGALDAYGNLENLPAGITIKTMTTYADSVSLTHRIGIVDGGTLKITGTTAQTGNSKIRVCEGGILIVDGGSLQNANLELVPGCQLIVRNNGTINMASGTPFNAPKGVVVNVENGRIQ